VYRLANERQANMSGFHPTYGGAAKNDMPPPDFSIPCWPRRRYDTAGAAVQIAALTEYGNNN